MAQPLIKFYRVAQRPQTGVPGALYFVSNEGVLYICTGETSFEAYAGLKSVSVEEGVVTISPSVGEAVSVDIKALAQGAVDLSAYAKSADVTSEIATAIAAEVERANGAYDAKGAAANAEAAAKADAAEKYQLKGNYEEAGAAAQALTDAKAHVAEEIGKLAEVYDAKGAAANAQSAAESNVKSWVGEQGFATEGFVGQAIEPFAGKVNTLIGSDADKSVRTIANEELAKQLIAEGAAESYDTLQEIAAWIQQHPEDAAAMSSDITSLKESVKTITDDYLTSADKTDLSEEIGSKTQALEKLLDALEETVGSNEQVTSAALNDLNERIGGISGEVSDIQEALEALPDTFVSNVAGEDGDALNNSDYVKVKTSTSAGTVSISSSIKIVGDIPAASLPVNYVSTAATGVATDKYVRDYVASQIAWGAF